MSKVYRSTYRIEAAVKTVYTGAGFAVPKTGEVMFSTALDKVVVMEYGVGRILAKASTGDGEVIMTMCCSDDGKWVFASSKSVTCYLWECEYEMASGEDPFIIGCTLRLFRSWHPTKHPISTCCFSPGPNPKWLFTAHTDGALRLWEPANNSLTHTLPNDGGLILKLAAIEVSGVLLVAATCFSGMLAVWNIGALRRVLSFKDHAGVAEAVAFFYNGAMLATGGRDGKINVYRLMVDAVKGSEARVEAAVSHSFVALQEVSTLACLTKQALGGMYEAVVDTPDADKEVMAMGGEKGNVVYFYMERTGRARKCKKEFLDAAQTHNPARITSIQPKGDRLIVVNTDHDIRFMNFVLEPKQLIVGNMDQVLDVRYGRDDQLLSANNSADIHVFHIESPFCELLSGHGDVVVALSLSRDKKLLASASKDRTARVWDLATMKCMAVLEALDDPSDVTGVAFANPAEGSSAPLTLITAQADLSLRVWNLRDVVNPKKLAKLRTAQGLPPDEPVVLKSTPNTTVPRAHEMDISAVCTNPTGELVASCSKDKTVKVWKLWGEKAGEGSDLCLAMRGAYKGHRKRVHCVAFSPFEKVLASGAGDTTVKLWSTATASSSEACLKTFQGHQNPVLALAFINRGLQLVSASSDGAIKVWGIKTQSCLASLAGHKDRVWGLDVHSDDRHFLSGGSDGVINVWRDFEDEDREEQQFRKAMKVKETQLLTDKMRNGEWGQVVELALRLEHPGDLRKAIRMMLKESPDTLTEVVKGITDDELLMKFLKYTREWMTNSLNADVAAACLSAIFSTSHVSRISHLPIAPSLLEPLMSYSVRHHDRLASLRQQLHTLLFFAGEPPAIPPPCTKRPLADTNTDSTKKPRL